MPTPAMNHATPQQGTHPGHGARLVSTEGRELPLKSAALRGQAGGGLARVSLEQVFANPFKEPLQLTYQMPLPADGAVSGYTIRIGERTLRGVIDTREAARERYEQALVDGRTAGLLEQERSSLFTQKIGNVPAGTEVRVTITVDQRLAWREEGQWEWRFPTVVAPRYLGGPGRVGDAEKVTVDVNDRPQPVRASLELAIDDRPAGAHRPESPSHEVEITSDATPSDRSSASGRDGSSAGRGSSPATHGAASGEPGHPTPGGPGATMVTFSGEGARLDRDIVVRWSVAAPATGVTLRRHRPSGESPHGKAAYGLLTLVPPAGPAPALRRDLILLIDTSGSMTGKPLDQARRIAGLLIESLGDEDTLEIVAFGSRPLPWKRGPVTATAEARRQAAAWAGKLQAGGGTEMVDAVEKALRPLDREAQRQVVLITDGLIGFEERVIRSIRDRLPAGSRLHVAGVGPAANRSLSSFAARAGRGREVLTGLDEDAERCAASLVAATRAPVVTDLRLEGSAVTGAAPRACPDLFAGSPVLAGVKLRPGGGDLVVRGLTAEGPWEHKLAVEPTAPGEGPAGVAALFARESVEDLELDLASGESRDEIDAQVERIGLEFAISTWRTSWVAVSTRQDVDPRDPSRTERIPQELPEGLSAVGLGLAPAGPDVGMTLTAKDSMVIGDFHGVAETAGGMRDTSRALAGPPLARTTHGQARIRPIRPDTNIEELQDELQRILRERGVSRPEAFSLPPRAGIRAHWTGRAGDGAWFLEFEVREGPLDWAPRPPALIKTGAGEILEQPIELEASSRPGRIEEGRLVRLAVHLSDEEKANAKEILVQAGRETLLLIVEP